MRVGQGEGRALGVDTAFAGLCQLRDKGAPSGILSPDVREPGLTEHGPLLDRSLEPQLQLRADSRFLKSQRSELVQGAGRHGLSHPQLLETTTWVLGFPSTYSALCSLPERPLPVLGPDLI